MKDLKQTVAADMGARFTKLAGQVHELATPLSDAQFWTKPFTYGNSIGHLMLHVTGNLSYYIGAQIAETGYVRDRPLEFSNSAQPSKAEVLKKFDEAIAMVLDTIGKQSAEDWSRDYTAVGADDHDRFGIVFSCASHLHHHIGQMMYLSFALRKG